MPPNRPGADSCCHRVLVVAVAAVAAARRPRAGRPRAELTPERHRVPPAHVPGRRARRLLRRLRRRRDGCTRRHMGNDLMGAKLDPRARGERRERSRSCTTTRRGTPATCSSSPAPTAGSTGTSTSTTTRPAPTTARTPRSGGSRPASHEGAHVKRGQFIAYMGDSGDAETTAAAPALRDAPPDDTFIDPYTSLRLAQGCRRERAVQRTRRTRAAHPTAPAAPASGRSARDGTVLGFGSAQTYPQASRNAPRTTRRPTTRYVGRDRVDRRRARATGSSTLRRRASRRFGDAHVYGRRASTHLNAVRSSA